MSWLRFTPLLLLDLSELSFQLYFQLSPIGIRVLNMFSEQTFEMETLFFQFDWNQLQPL